MDRACPLRAPVWASPIPGKRLTSPLFIQQLACRFWEAAMAGGGRQAMLVSDTRFMSMLRPNCS